MIYHWSELPSRIDGPYYDTNVAKIYMVNGMKHRVGGPAVIAINNYMREEEYINRGDTYKTVHTVLNNGVTFTKDFIKRGNDTKIIDYWSNSDNVIWRKVISYDIKGVKMTEKEYNEYSKRKFLPFAMKRLPEAHREVDEEGQYKSFLNDDMMRLIWDKVKEF